MLGATGGTAGFGQPAYQSTASLRLDRIFRNLMSRRLPQRETLHPYLNQGLAKRPSPHERVA
jgi:hypothetical protein